MRQLWFVCERLYWTIRRWFMRRVRGYADADVINADYTIAKFALPLVRALRKDNYHCLDDTDLDGEKWEAILDEIIFALDWTVNGQYSMEYESMYDYIAASDRAAAGYELFGKYFMKLWT